MTCYRVVSGIGGTFFQLILAAATSIVWGCQVHHSVSSVASHDALPQCVPTLNLTTDQQARPSAKDSDSHEWQTTQPVADTIPIKQDDWHPTSRVLPSTNAVAACIQPISHLDQVSYEESFASGNSTQEVESFWKDAQTQGISPYPINLATVLRLAGADNWDVQFAVERVHEARMRLKAAQAMWLPSLVIGLGYTKHDGKLQESAGNVVEVSRNALFVGGGARIGSGPLAGGGGGPARLMVNLSLADAIFKPLVERQLVDAEQARESVTYNDTLLAASLAYFELVHAQGQLHNARNKDLKNAEELFQQIRVFVHAGKGSKADVARMQIEVNNRKQQVVEATAAVSVVSAELVRLLQLSPETKLIALEDQPDKPVAVELVAEKRTLPELVSQGLSNRPELFEHLSRTEAARRAAQAERLRPWFPNVFVGASAGGLGGGVNNSFPQMDGRSDFDILAVWEMRGDLRAVRKQRNSQYRQSVFAWYRRRDQVVTEITQAYHLVHAQREQISLAESNLEAGMRALELNRIRIKGFQGLPLEALQAVQSMAAVNDAYVKAVVEYNKAQVRLVRAIGNSIEQN